MLFLGSLENLLHDAHIIFQKSADIINIFG